MLLNGGSGYSADVLESMGGGEVKQLINGVWSQDALKISQRILDLRREWGEKPVCVLE